MKTYLMPPDGRMALPLVVERWEYLILPKKTNRSMNEFAEIKG